MHRLFESSKEPLFGRANKFIRLQPFTPQELYSILKDNQQDNQEVLFNYYIFTGGFPKYVELLLMNKVFTLNNILDYIFTTGSTLLEEGKNVLIEEFGKEYGTYFSILETIATGKNSRSEIESVLQINIGGYLQRLLNDYDILNKYHPINAKPNTKMQKYRIKDNYLQFWFRFIYRNRSVVETNNFKYMKQIIDRDFRQYQGILLEKLFHDIFLHSHKYNLVGYYWEKNNFNEIDLIAINDIKKKITFTEIKLNVDKINLNTLKSKAVNLLMDYKNYQAEYLKLSLDNVFKFL